MTSKIRVGVIFGGRSGEHEVSVRSARAVIESFDRTRYEVIPISISKEGRWLSPAESAALLPESARGLLSENVSGAGEALTIVGDPSRRGLHRFESEGGGGASAQRLDVVFPVMHGTYGEDGTIQGLLEMAGLPYVGCGVLASSCGMDKVAMKTLFRDAGLPQCDYTWFVRSEFEREPRRVINRVARRLGFPCFVKPANLGSSVGISRAVDKATLELAIDLAARYDRKIIIEEG